MLALFGVNNNTLEWEVTLLRRKVFEKNNTIVHETMRNPH